MHREAELREMLDEADYWHAAASHEEMLEKQHELEVEQAIETSRCLPPPNIYLQAERSRSRPTLSPTSFSDASCPMRAIAYAALC